MRHDIKTTIVEIDPAVYRAARTYFALPDAGRENVFLEDARGWVSKQKTALEKGEKIKQYDIVIHDCFSGGGVPEHIFTAEFWNDLRALMKPEGVIVVVSRVLHDKLLLLAELYAELRRPSQVRIVTPCHQYFGKELWSMSCIPRYV